MATRLGFENLDGLRGAISEQINGQHQTALRQAVKKNVLDALADGEAFDVPPSLLKQEYESVAKAMNGDAKDHGQNEGQDDGEDRPAVDEGMDPDSLLVLKRLPYTQAR